MWAQTYLPLRGSLALSALAASLPILVLLYLLGLRRKPAWQASLAGLAAAILVAEAVYRMPARPLISSIGYGAAFGLFPIGWVVFTAILLFRLTVETGQFEIIKQSIGSISRDPRLQALLIAFAFGAFIEGAAGFGTPVAVAGAMLAGVGFAPFEAAALCLLANTSPVAFGSIGTPLIALAGVTGLPLARLSAMVGRICAPVSLFVPAYLVGVQSGRRGLRGVWPAAAVCGVSFAVTQFFVSNFVAAQLTDILASLAAIIALLIMLKFWRPRDSETVRSANVEKDLSPQKYSRGVLLRAWAPYAFLVVFVLLWGYAPVKAQLDHATLNIPWPGLHNQIQRVQPVVTKPAPYAAIFSFAWLAAPGTACLFASIFAAFFAMRMKPREFVRICFKTLRTLLMAEPHHRGGAGAGVSDELQRSDCHAGPRVCNHRPRISIFRLGAGMPRSFPYRLRHFFERPVRQSASCHRRPLGIESGVDGRGKFLGRRDGENDQPAKHRCGSGGDRPARIRRSKTFSIHSAAQSAVGGNRGRDRARICISGSQMVGLGQGIAREVLQKRFCERRDKVNSRNNFLAQALVVGNEEVYLCDGCAGELNRIRRFQRFITADLREFARGGHVEGDQDAGFHEGLLVFSSEVISLRSSRACQEFAYR